MNLYKCDHCGAPTDNDQSFIVGGVGGIEPHLLEVHRCDACDKRLEQEMDWESEGETIQEDTIICPYCEYEYTDYEGYHFDEGTTDEVECDACGHKFDLDVQVSRTYSTKRSLSEMPDDYGEDDGDT